MFYQPNCNVLTAAKIGVLSSAYFLSTTISCHIVGEHNKVIGCRLSTKLRSNILVMKHGGINYQNCYYILIAFIGPTKFLSLMDS